MVDLDVYVGTQTVILFGKERDMKRLTTEEYFNMNYLDGQFMDKINSIEVNLTQDAQTALANFKEKDNPEAFQKFQLQTQKDMAKKVDREIKKVILERETQVRQFVKSIIPSLTKEEMEQITVNLYNAIKREIEVQIWMDKYYTRDEAIQMIKQGEIGNFQNQPAVMNEVMAG